ncbi:MAG TPA: FG-GAP-like repeat-containing protein [Sphingomonas sp.]
MPPIDVTSDRARAWLQEPGYYLGSSQFTFSVPTAASVWTAYSPGSEPFDGYRLATAALADAFRRTLAMWDDLIAPDFREVADDANGAGELRVAFSALDAGEAGHAYQGPPQRPGGRVGDVWINDDYAADPFASGQYMFMAVAHEIGHTLGLKHTFEQPSPIPAQLDSHRFSVMSYSGTGERLIDIERSGAQLNVSASWVYAATPMVVDIAAVQAIYGADTGTRAGDDVYRFKERDPALRTIYDAGGVDTFDLSDFTLPNVVDLRPASYSSIGYWSREAQAAYWKAQFPEFDFTRTFADPNVYTWTDNVGIALSTVIENARGGSAADTLIGNDVANVLSGGGGADRLTGGGGADVFEGRRAELAGDTLTDLSPGDRLRISDAGFGDFSFQRIGTSLNLGGGAALSVGAGPLGFELRAGGTGVDLIATVRDARLRDFDGDGHGDFLWRNGSSGAFSTWGVTGNGMASAFNRNSYYEGGVATAWAIGATLDWNGDGATDLLFRHTSGTFTIWLSRDASFTVNAYDDFGSVTTDWRLGVAGDFNGDGRDDLIWRHDSGVITQWRASGSGFEKNVYVDGGVPTGWRLIGATDHDGDGRDDLFWRENASGAFSIWTSTGTGFRADTYTDRSVSPDWQVGALADFNGDGRGDVLWRHPTGAITIWSAEGGGFRANSYAENSVSSVWRIEQALDLNIDGRSDLVFRNASTGHFSVWLATGDGFLANAAYDASVSTDWALIASTGVMV